MEKIKNFCIKFKVIINKKPNYKYAILLIGTSLLTRSGNSIVLIGAIVGIKILTDLLQKNRKVFFRAFFSTVILIIAFITIILCGIMRSGENNTA